MFVLLFHCYATLFTGIIYTMHLSLLSAILCFSKKKKQNKTKQKQKQNKTITKTKQFKKKNKTIQKKKNKQTKENNNSFYFDYSVRVVTILLKWSFHFIFV